MPEQDVATGEILDMVNAHPGCTLDELTQRLPNWNWSEIFIEVDRLSRIGRLQLTQSGAGFITTLHATKEPGMDQGGDSGGGSPCRP